MKYGAVALQVQCSVRDENDCKITVIVCQVVHSSVCTVPGADVAGIIMC